MAYHVSPNGPSLCKAKHGRCPYGADGENHFATVTQASAFYEERMAQAFGGFETVKRNSAQIRKEKYYTKRDKIASFGRKLQRSAPAVKAVEALKSLRSAPADVKLKLKKAKRDAIKTYAVASALSRQASVELQARSQVAKAEAKVAFTKASDETKARFNEYKRTALEANARRVEAREVEKNLGGKLRPQTLDQLQIGDRLENGNVIAKFKTVNGITTVTTRNTATGRFGKSEVLQAGAALSVIRPRRNLLRQAGKAYSSSRTAAVERTRATMNNVSFRTRGVLDTTRSRVTHASSLQREAFRALIGVDREGIAKRDEYRKAA